MTDWLILNKLFHVDCLGFNVGRIRDYLRTTREGSQETTGNPKISVLLARRLAAVIKKVIHGCLAI